MKKIIYIVSDIEKALAFEWLSVSLASHFELSFILICKEGTTLMLFLKEHRIPFYHVNTAASFPIQWWKVFTILRGIKPYAVHTHMWKANLLGLSSAWLLGIPKRIFTRHHAVIHYNEYPSGLKWDKLCNRLATDIVAISENVKNILVKHDGAKESKIHTIHHGFDLNYFIDIENERIDGLRNRYAIGDGFFPVVGVIARYTKWKGVQFIIEGFKELRTKFPTAHLILANAEGDYKKSLKLMLQELPKGSFTEITFENDLSALYKLFNVYVHVPTNEFVEAFGQTYIEALASGIPSVFTLSGVAKEFILDSKNALVVEYESSRQICEAIQKILENDSLTRSLISEGQLSAQKFSLENMLTKLKYLYA
jgi:glycosyltransferase involved in cell wall biosynthesis